MVPSRRPGLTVAVAAALLVAAIAGVVVYLAADSDDGSAEVAGSATTSATPTTAPASTAPTLPVVEHEPLPTGVREVVTVDPAVDDVAVSATPPPGWDVSLSPVITSTDLQPPRTALDTARVPMPSTAAAISGRHVADGGWTFSNPTTFDPPQPLVFGVVQRQGDWVQVLLPVRPNGTSGWLRDDQLTVSRTDLSVEVSLTDRRVRVVRGGTEEFSAPIAIGRPATPTPTGEFYVTDIVPSVNPAGGYGPVALALNGYSEAMDAFAGESGTGPDGREPPDAIAPVLALHGTNRPATVGQALSNGCPRLYNDDMVRLAEMVPAGTPVRIWP